MAFRQWALGSPREFGLVFANPIADSSCARRELLTLANSGHLFTDRLHALWLKNHYPVPGVRKLPSAIRDTIRNFAPRLGLADDWKRLEKLMRTWLAD